MDEDKIIKKLDHHEKRLDKITDKLLEHDETLKHIKEEMATRDDVDKILNGQDKMIQLFTRIDQERLFGNERMKRLETDVKMIKQHLQLA